MPMAMGYVSPKPLVGEWHPAHALSLCSDAILSKKSKWPRFANWGSIGRPSRPSMLEPAVPVKPALLSAAISWPSKSFAEPKLAIRKNSSALAIEAAVLIMALRRGLDRVASHGIAAQVYGANNKCVWSDYRRVRPKAHLQLISLPLTEEVEVVG